MRAVGMWGKWNIDASRHAREIIPASEYLRMSYYEKWIAGLVDLLVQRGLVTSSGLESGKLAQESPKAIPPLTADTVPMLGRHSFASRNVAVAPLFQVGQPVRARNIHPVEHTRLPRYARGKLGTIERDHGVFVFPDTHAHFLGEKPQHVYSVRFAARELWGE